MTNHRPIGASDLSTPPLVLGGNVFGWTADPKTSFAVLDAFMSGGGTMIDTADIYSAFVPGNKGGESETIIGEWLHARGRRDDVLIATKVGYKGGLARSQIETAVEGSLQRLQTDHIDLYYAHTDDSDVPIDDVIETFDRLVKAGKVRAIAASNFQPDRLAAALDISEARGLARYNALQPHYNLVDRKNFEGPLQQLCIARNLAVFPYYGLASGFLTGKYREETDSQGKARARAVDKYLNERGFRILAALDEVAADTGRSLAQVALAWLAAQPGVTAPIASATNVRQVEDLLGAMRLQLTPAQIARLDAVD